MGELKQRPGDQPLPVPNNQPDVQSMVIADIAARREVGIARYGSPLQPFNGRDSLQDAFEEALDLTMYLRQMIAERAAGDRPPLVDAPSADGTGPAWEGVRAGAARRLDGAIGAACQTWTDVVRARMYEVFVEEDPVRIRAKLHLAVEAVQAWIDDLDRRRGIG